MSLGERMAHWIIVIVAWSLLVSYLAALKFSKGGY
jgi:hypothetical protein